MECAVSEGQIKEIRVRGVDSRLQLPPLHADDDPMEQPDPFVLDTVWRRVLVIAAVRTWHFFYFCLIIRSIIRLAFCQSGGIRRLVRQDVVNFDQVFIRDTKTVFAVTEQHCALAFR
jgi:hypothetical protein